MSLFLGIDTSNYTTSCALYDSETGDVRSCRRLLPVKKGERGLRQSEAVFHHTKQLHVLIKDLLSPTVKIEAAAYSFAPRLAEGSYMPCFLVGESVGESIAAAMGISVFRTSHQIGHILAALYSCGRLDFLKNKQRFLAYHVSGGTTDLLLCEPGEENILDITRIGGSKDLKAGQCIDRIGVKLGLDFPCGSQLEKLAVKSDGNFKIKPCVNGLDCCLSGVENLCIKMLDNSEKPENTARFCLDYIGESICLTVKNAIKKYGNLPVVFAGGVMSDLIIRRRLECEFYSFFAKPEFSSDNAAGIAVYAAKMKGMI